jgi:hypothetical protein
MTLIRVSEIRDVTHRPTQVFYTPKFLVGHLFLNCSRPSTLNPEVYFMWTSKKEGIPFCMNILLILLNIDSKCHNMSD